MYTYIQINAWFAIIPKIRLLKIIIKLYIFKFKKCYTINSDRHNRPNLYL